MEIHPPMEWEMGGSKPPGDIIKRKEIIMSQYCRVDPWHVTLSVCEREMIFNKITNSILTLKSKRFKPTVSLPTRKQKELAAQKQREVPAMR